MSTSHVEYHADDYGLFPEQSERILACADQGVLNGVSIMPNSPYLAACMEALEPYRDRMAITIHLNFVEGRALSPAGEIPDLVDEDGNYSISFGKMTLGSYNPFVCGRLKRQLKRELQAQMKACLPYLDQDHIRLDGHVHYHMIPVLFDALVEVIEENHYHVTFIRFPEEDLSLYQAHKGEIDKVLPINRIKVLVLNHFGRRNRRRHAAFLQDIEIDRFMGVLFSGHMSYENVQPLLADAVARAGEENRNLEVLFHPGSVLEENRVQELTSSDDVAFLTSNWRSREAEALRRLAQ